MKMMNSNTEDKELQDKLTAARWQHYEDKFFDMKPASFFDGLSGLPEKRNHVPYQPNQGYGTYEEQQARFKAIDVDLINALINGN